jgi:hypothetical protein
MGVTVFSDPFLEMEEEEQKAATDAAKKVSHKDIAHSVCTWAQDELPADLRMAQLVCAK